MQKSLHSFSYLYFVEWLTLITAEMCPKVLLTGIPRRYCRVWLQTTAIKQITSFFGFLVHICFTLYYSLLSVQ